MKYTDSLLGLTEYLLVQRIPLDKLREANRLCAGTENTEYVRGAAETLLEVFPGGNVPDIDYDKARELLICYLVNRNPYQDENTIE